MFDIHARGTPQRLLDTIQLTFYFFRRDHRTPLEWGQGFGDERIDAQSQLAARYTMGTLQLRQGLRHLNQFVDVLIRFCRQTHHVVQFEIFNTFDQYPFRAGQNLF